MSEHLKLTKEEQAAHARSLASGIQKRMSGMSVIILDGASTTPADMVKRLDDYAELRDRVDRTHDDYQDAVAKADAAEPGESAYMAACTRLVRATFGNEAAVLAEFGLEPTKARKPQTVAEKAAVVAKRESTRVARGTKGAAQKAAIHGNVTGVEITPVTEPGTAQPPAAEAPAARGVVAKS